MCGGEDFASEGLVEDLFEFGAQNSDVVVQLEY
jgi:hypothetical protein